MQKYKNTFFLKTFIQNKFDIFSSINLQHLQLGEITPINQASVKQNSEYSLQVGIKPQKVHLCKMLSIKKARQPDDK